MSLDGYKPRRKPRALQLEPRKGSMAAKVVAAYDGHPTTMHEILTATGASRVTAWRALERWRPNWRKQLWEKVT